MKKVWLYSIASFVSAAVLLTGQILGGNASAPLMGEGLGLIVVLVSCQICFHLNRVDELLVDSKPRVFIQKVLKSAAAGLVLAAILSYIVPRLPPSFVAAAVSAFLVLFGLAVLRPLAPPFAQRQGAEETLVVGSGVVARKLYEELTVHNAPDDVRMVQYSDLRGFSGRTGISRIVVADCVLHNDEDATHALLDLKLRGVRIESAAESFERTGRRIWLEGLSLERLIFAEGFCPSRVYLACKRLADALFSAALLAVTAPLMRQTRSRLFALSP